MPEIIALLNCIFPIIKPKEQKQLQIIIEALLSMRGRITMLGLSRWSQKGASYRTMIRFFHSTLDWGTINWLFIKTHLTKNRASVYLLGGDEVVISKSGKKSYGLDRFYSSIQNQTIQSLAFLNLSLISVESKKAYPLINKQIIKTNKKGCIKNKSSKKDKKPKSKSTRGRPKGSANKDKNDIVLPPYLLFVRNALKEVLLRINKHVDIAYFVYDGAFGNNQAMQMVRQSGLYLISKLQKNSALSFPYKGEYSGKGAPRQYGEDINYTKISDDYLRETTTDEEKNIITKIYQMKMLHRKFADALNVVIIQRINTKTNSMAHVTLFSSDLNLTYKKVIEYYSLRFQIEFVFRDAKQYWGMEDFMNIKQTPIENWANLSTFMVSFSHALRNNPEMKDMSVLDLKARYHGLKYVTEVFKLVPNLANEYLIQKVFSKIANLGAIHPSQEAA
jgi:hypothetical protein